MGEGKPVVFVITPFNEDFLSLFEEFKRQFGAQFEFTNAGDLDNQQNILKDIVEGIANADVVIADLTGLNPNVFYELGLAHAMNKKVIIITQELDELPFDIRPYRANPYSLQFNKLPALMTELQKLLNGAMDGSIQFGNPVADHVPNFQKPQIERSVVVVEDGAGDQEEAENSLEKDNMGFLDYLEAINENSDAMCQELNDMGQEITDMGDSVTDAVGEIDRVKGKTGTADSAFVRGVCRKLSEPIGVCAEKIHRHVANVTTYWEKVENDYLALLDNRFIKKPENIEDLKKTMDALDGMQTTINASNEQVDAMITSLKGSMGMERRLTKAVASLITELQTYLTMTETICASTDRLISKSEMVIAELEEIKVK